MCLGCVDFLSLYCRTKPRQRPAGLQVHTGHRDFATWKPRWGGLLAGTEEIYDARTRAPTATDGEHAEAALFPARRVTGSPCPPRPDTELSLTDLSDICKDNIHSPRCRPRESGMKY